MSDIKNKADALSDVLENLQTAHHLITDTIKPCHNADHLSFFFPQCCLSKAKCALCRKSLLR